MTAVTAYGHTPLPTAAPTAENALFHSLSQLTSGQVRAAEGCFDCGRGVHDTTVWQIFARTVVTNDMIKTCSPFIDPVTIPPSGNYGLNDRIETLLRSFKNSSMLTPSDKGRFNNATVSVIINTPSLLRALFDTARDLSLVSLFSIKTEGTLDLSQADTISAKATIIREWLEAGNGQNITTITCSGKGISCIPEELRFLSNLQTLDLSHNHIWTIPGWIGTLTSLTNINLSYNRIKTFPDALSQLVRTRTLDLSNTDIEKLPDSVANLRENLQLLNVGNCHITSIAASALELPQHSLEIRGNRRSLITIYDHRGAVLFTGRDNEVSDWLESTRTR